MKKLLAFGLFLSMALWGCSDDSSSVSSESPHGASHDIDLAESSAETAESSAATETKSSASTDPLSSATTEPASGVESEPSSSAEAVSSDDQTNPLSGTSDETFDVPKSGFVRGKCMNNSLAKAAAPAGGSESEKLPEAYLGYAGGEPFIEIHDVSDYCDLVAKISQKVKGDTLFVAYYDITMASKCICPFDSHKFFIDRENAGLPLFSFNNVVYQVIDLLID